MEGVYSDYLQPHYVKTYSKVWKQRPYIKALPASSELSQASFPTQEAARQLLQPLSVSPANTPPSADSVGAISPPRSSASPLDPDLPLLSGVPGYQPLAPHFVRRRGREPGRQPPRVPGPQLLPPPPPRSTPGSPCGAAHLVGEAGRQVEEAKSQPARRPLQVHRAPAQPPAAAMAGQRPLPAAPPPEGGEAAMSGAALTSIASLLRQIFVLVIAIPCT